MWHIDSKNIPKDATIYEIRTLDDLYKLIEYFSGGTKNAEKPVAYYDGIGTINHSNPYLAKLEAISNPEANPG